MQLLSYKNITYSSRYNANRSSDKREKPTQRVRRLMQKKLASCSKMDLKQDKKGHTAIEDQISFKGTLTVWSSAWRTWRYYYCKTRRRISNIEKIVCGVKNFYKMFGEKNYITYYVNSFMGLESVLNSKATQIFVGHTMAEADKETKADITLTAPIINPEIDHTYAYNTQSNFYGALNSTNILSGNEKLNEFNHQQGKRSKKQESVIEPLEIQNLIGRTILDDNKISVMKQESIKYTNTETSEDNTDIYMTTQIPSGAIQAKNVACTTIKSDFNLAHNTSSEYQIFYDRKLRPETGSSMPDLKLDDIVNANIEIISSSHSIQVIGFSESSSNKNMGHQHGKIAKHNEKYQPDRVEAIVPGILMFDVTRRNIIPMIVASALPPLE